ncbi:MAG: hypothetical protein P4L82_12205 [Ancalomicrobiaceae bacterium]|nr:hypothetical protein [Ancalomicrobiaceae bacterium]
MRALLLAILLTACGQAPVSTPIAPAVPPRLDAVIAADCNDPVPLPNFMAAEKIPSQWARDRAALLDCAGRHRAGISADDRNRKAIGFSVKP